MKKQLGIYFVHGLYGSVEVDYRLVDGMLPKLSTRPHPHPQHWYDVRQQAMERDRFRCTACNKSGKEATLDAHHRTYANWGREILEDVYILCRNCHDVLHTVRRAA